MFHYYLMVGLIPVSAIIFYTNVFIGPAQLTPIPEGYVPKHWEYHRHPITRFIARYIHNSPQQVNRFLDLIYLSIIDKTFLLLAKSSPSAERLCSTLKASEVQGLAFENVGRIWGVVVGMGFP